MVNGIAALDQAEELNPHVPAQRMPGGMPGGMPDQRRRDLPAGDIMNMLMGAGLPPVGVEERQEEANGGGDDDHNAEHHDDDEEEGEDEDDEDENITVCGSSIFIIIRFIDILPSQPLPGFIGNIFGRLFGRARVEESSSSASEEEGDDDDDDDVRDRGDLNAVD